MTVIDHDWLLLPDMHSEIIVENPEVLKIERGKSNLQVRSSVEKTAESLLTGNSKGANRVQAGHGWALSFATEGGSVAPVGVPCKRWGCLTGILKRSPKGCTRLNTLKSTANPPAVDLLRVTKTAFLTLKGATGTPALSYRNLPPPPPSPKGGFFPRLPLDSSLILSEESSVFPVFSTEARQCEFPSIALGNILCSFRGTCENSRFDFDVGRSYIFSVVL